ncbi:malonic semialdehyde reductase [Actinoplanes sp. NBRC 103695]|uniref:malonic semialdehyde reductase n=1 Tax=Actinoplanes sp. NBRC 103695 TaxID=3032202 RepID=UPI0024A0C9C2|nr:malonic semialdehyde reductase [Actinoplanes sp. NBRC 103695]GLY97977.1 putative NADH dehydrogenase/NAD(P)H nitroreductase [Actinoplanes sp. NBRC 103695]
MRRADPEALGLLFTEAHTVKRFSAAPVGDDQLTEIWDLAKWPPTMFNVQPLRVLFVRTAEGFDRLLPHLTERNRAQSASAPVTAVLALDRDYHRHADRVVPHMPQLREYLEADEAERLELGRFSAALQAGYLILAIRAAGLHAGPMSGFDRDGLDREFFPDGRCTTLLVVNIGHPDGAGSWRERQARLHRDDVLRWA